MQASLILVAACVRRVHVAARVALVYEDRQNFKRPLIGLTASYVQQALVRLRK